MKHVWHHGLAWLGGAVLLVFCLFTTWLMVLQRDLPTLIAACSGVIYYCGPLYIIFVNERLVARDALDGTGEFLAGLPISPWKRMLVGFSVGLAVVGVVFEGMLLSTALIASRREGLPLLWLLQIHAQIGLYTLGWFAVSFGVVHLGRFRWLFWWLFFTVGLELEGTWLIAPFRRWYWTAPLADPLEFARSLPPWDSIVPVAIWSSLGLAVAVVSRVFRGGMLFDAVYLPSSSRQRASLVILSVLALGVVPFFAGLAPPPPTWDSVAAVPSATANVKVVGKALEPVAADVITSLESLSATYGVDRWADVVLVPSKRNQDPFVRRARGSEPLSPVLLVDPRGPRDRLVREIVQHVLHLQLTGHAPDLPGALVIVQGLPRLHESTPPQSSDVSHRWASVSLGPDDAEQVAAGLLARWRDDDPVAFSAAIQRVLSLRPGDGVPGRLRLQWASSGVPVGTTEALPTLPGVTIREGDGLVVDIPAQGASAVLEVLELDPLQPSPRWTDRGRMVPIDQRASVPIAVAASEAVAVRWQRYDANSDRFLASPWTIR